LTPPLVTAGRVGGAHGRDGSFYVEGADHPFGEGTALVLGPGTHTVERRAGTDQRPLVRLSGLGDREAIAELRGRVLLVEEELADGEWLAGELVGCEVIGLGTVRGVLDGPSCDLLELDDGTLVPFVSDAITSVDAGARRIEVRREFLQ
jgi:16S rRNA processing protein RimM